MSDFEDVVLAITYVTNPADHTIYVERRGGRFRWSIAHRGGPHALLREIAAYAGLPQDQIAVVSASVEGWTIVRAEPVPREKVDAYGFIQPATDPAIVGARIVALSHA